MIKGEFKDEYNQSVQKVINDRLEQTKEMEERLSSSQQKVVILWHSAMDWTRPQMRMTC